MKTSNPNSKNKPKNYWNLFQLLRNQISIIMMIRIDWSMWGNFGRRSHRHKAKLIWELWKMRWEIMHWRELKGRRLFICKSGFRMWKTFKNIKLMLGSNKHAINKQNYIFYLWNPNTWNKKTSNRTLTAFILTLIAKWTNISWQCYFHNRRTDWFNFNMKEN